MIIDADCHISSQKFDNLAVTEEISHSLMRVFCAMAE